MTNYVLKAAVSAVQIDNVNGNTVYFIDGSTLEVDNEFITNQMPQHGDYVINGDKVMARSAFEAMYVEEPPVYVEEAETHMVEAAEESDIVEESKPAEDTGAADAVEESKSAEDTGAVEESKSAEFTDTADGGTTPEDAEAASQ